MAPDYDSRWTEGTPIASDVEPRDLYLEGLIEDVFRRHEITEVSISSLPEIVQELAQMIEDIAKQSVEQAFDNL